jgi:hypothetical protein
MVWLQLNGLVGAVLPQPKRRARCILYPVLPVGPCYFALSTGITNTLLSGVAYISYAYRHYMNCIATYPAAGIFAHTFSERW